MKKNIKTEKGFIGLLSVVIMAALAIGIATTLTIISVSRSRSSLISLNSRQTRLLADACAENALQSIYANSSLTGTSNISILGGNCSYTITSGIGDNRTLTITATYQTYIRKIAITVSQINPNINLTSWQETP